MCSFEYSRRQTKSKCNATANHRHAKAHKTHKHRDLKEGDRTWNARRGEWAFVPFLHIAHVKLRGIGLFREESARIDQRVSFQRKCAATDHDWISILGGQMRSYRLCKIRQRFEPAHLADIQGALRQQLTRLDDVIGPGSRIAIAAGSRGIDNLALLVRELSDYLKARGAHPFIVPAMGSHGGATAGGQADILQLYGISEGTIGAPVRSSMDAVELPRGDLSFRIFMDRHVHESDGAILINRIKPHTDFHGRYESGLMKMALIGLGKLEGASAVHDFGLYGLRELIAPGAAQVLSTGKILAGIGVVENAFHQTLHVEVLQADAIARDEPRLLDLARRHMPRLPVDAVDVLVVDRMGKDISGVGIDPNITGRIGVGSERDATSPRVGAMMVCDLTAETRGNAIGVGLADVITRLLFSKIDYAATYGNVITSSFLERGKIPIVAETDREAFDIALRSCGHVPEGHERIVRILDTLHLDEVYVSPAYSTKLHMRIG